MTLVELTIAMGVIATLIVVSMNFVGTNAREVTLNEDRAFAVQKATMMVGELRGVAERPDTEDASTLDSYDDGTGTSNLLCADLTVVDPRHEFSGNLLYDGRWRYSRRITVRKFPSLDTRDVRIVTVRVFLTSAAQQDDTTLAEVTSVINTVATAYPPSQVYDTYLLACENVPGWWVYMSYIRPFVENALDDLEARQPGLVFRRHWINKLGYGRDPLYRPYFNKALDSNQTISSVYFYPGTMPAGSAVDQYYVPDMVKARINVDGTTKNDYDGDVASVTYNQYPYALADQFNHCMRQPVEKALFDQRVAAGQDTSDSPTWRLLLDDMIADPNRYKNAIFINLHGELVPFPPVRNYSDAAKEPTGYPNVRVVTHPQELCFQQGDPLVMRIYGYQADAGAFTATSAAVASGAATISVTSTAGFPNASWINIEGNLIRYTGKTGTSFTGCSGTFAHGLGVQVLEGPNAAAGWASAPLTAGVAAGAGTVNVARTTGFLPSGKVVVEGDLIDYTGLTATSFTGCSGALAHSAGGTAYQYLGRPDFLTTPVTVFLPGLKLDQAGDVTVHAIRGGTDQEPADRVPDPYVSGMAPTSAGSGSTAERMYASVAYLDANPPTVPVAGTQVTLYNTPLKRPNAMGVPSTIPTAAIAAGAATINVATTASFPPSGQLNCEGNLITYSGITPTSFTGCGGAIAHVAGRALSLVGVVASTSLTANAAIGAATLTVASTASFPTSGRVRLEGDVVNYTGKTATTLTGCTGVLVAHVSGRTVYTASGMPAPTALTIAVGAGATTISVGSTDAFPSAGLIGVEGNLIPYTGTTATSFTGCRNVVAHAAGAGVDLPQVPSTVASVAVAAGAVTITVLSTAAFPPAGEIVMEGDLITYTGTTATTFTGCAGAVAHVIGTAVYAASAGLAPGWRLYGDEYVPCPCDAASTTSTAAVAAGAATITVASTTSFPTRGQINIEGNLITYTGTTATTFTGCVDATAHLSGAGVDFCANLVLPSNRPKNTASWVVTVSKAALDRVENLGAGTERVVTIETRIGSDLSTGVVWPTANQPPNLSTTYAWRGNVTLYDANQAFVPFSERFQFQGDPRHCPYLDVKAGHGYNWYFDNLRDAGVNQIANWPGFDAARIRNSNGADYDGWHGSGANGTLADSIELDVPRYFQWLRNGLCTSNSIYTTLTGFSYYYMGNGNEIGYDSANGFANSIPTNTMPFTGAAVGTRYEQSIIDAQTGGVKLVRENTDPYWWSKPWVGENCPDSAYAAWAANGNLPAGNGAGNFVRIRRQDIRTTGVAPLAKPQTLPSGTTFSDHRTLRRMNAKGCTSFFNIGTSISTFRHNYRDATTGNLGAGGAELDATYNFPVPTNTKISRPFQLTFNTTTDEFSMAEYSATRASASSLLTYYSHQDGTPPWFGSALIREQLLAASATSPSCFIAVNGIDRTVETGSAFIATFSTLTLIHTFLSAGLPGTPSRVTELPQVVIRQPNDATELKDPATITLQWSANWLRWDGLSYTPQYPAGFTEDDTVLKYSLLYSTDNGSTWLHILDNSPATPGDPNEALWVNDAVLGGDESFVWDVVNGVYLDEASYLIRVEAYRSNIPAVHYSFHQQKIFVDR